MLLVEIQHSKLTGVAMLLTHAGGLMAIVWVDVSIWIKFLLVMLVLASLRDVFRKVVLRRAENAVTAIVLDSDNNMTLIYRSGRNFRVARIRSVFISPVVTLLTVAIEGKRLSQSLVIPFDAVDKEKFRQLRVSLKTI